MTSNLLQPAFSFDDFDGIFSVLFDYIEDELYIYHRFPSLRENYPPRSLDKKGLFYTSEIVRSHYTQEKHCGVFLADGKVIIPFYYHEIKFNEEEQCFYCFYPWIMGERKNDIHKRDTSGRILYDYNGKTLSLDSCYDIIDSFSEGLCAVHQGLLAGVQTEEWPYNVDGWSFINEDGIRVIDLTNRSMLTKSFVKNVTSFKEGYSVVCEFTGLTGTVYKYINKQGEDAFSMTFWEAHPFENGLALVRNSGYNSGYNYITSDGKLLLSKNVFKIGPFVDDLALITIDKHSHHQQRIDKLGRLVFLSDGKEIRFHINLSNIVDFGDFHDGLCVFSKRLYDGHSEIRYGVINEKGEVVIEARYNHISDFSNGSATIAFSHKGINHGGWDYTPFAHNGTIRDRYITAEVDKRLRIIVRFEDHSLILPTEYEAAFVLDDSFVEVIDRHSELVGVLNQYGEIILPCNYYFIKKENEVFITYSSHYDHPVYTLDGHIVFPKEIESICKESGFIECESLGESKRYKAYNGTHWALLDESGNNLTGFIFDYIQPYSSTLGILSVGGNQSGYIDCFGNEIKQDDE